MNDKKHRLIAAGVRMKLKYLTTKIFMMKKLIKKNVWLMILFCITMTTTAITAQQRGPHGDRPQGPPEIPNVEQIQKMVGHMAVENSMTEEQQEQVIALLTTHFKAVKEKKEADRKEMETLKKDLEAQVGKVLDDKQMEEFRHFMEKPEPRKPRPDRRRH
jgi:hypothetical protein